MCYYISEIKSHRKLEVSVEDNIRLLKAIRAKFGTQAEYARVIGEPESKVSEVIKNKRNLSEADRELYASPFTLSAKYYFGK